MMRQPRPAVVAGDAAIPETSIASPSRAASRIFTGTSGWAYPTWKPAFYPQGTSARKLLAAYTAQLNSVEVNYTFTKLPTPEQAAGWLTQSTPGFRFSFKAPQRITHWSRLADCEPHLAEFFATLAPFAASGHAGCVLFQLPPNFKADPARLRDFLSTPTLAATSLPLAFEFRHESWFADPCTQLLADRGAALCIADTDALTTPELHTASSIACFRLRRDGGYTPAEIGAFAKRFKCLARTRDVYAYFRHQEAPTGALNARDLLAALAPGVRPRR